MIYRSFILAIPAALISLRALAFSPGDCGITNKPGTPALQRYCSSLRQEAINSDPGHILFGKLEKAKPIEGEPASQNYYWIDPGNGESQTYFDGNSAIGKRILKVCKVSQRCAVKVGEEKSYAHNLDHATIWITKILGEPLGE
jgi:hypothetical protein